MDGRSATALTCLNVAHRCVFCLPEKMAGSTRAFLVAEMPEAEEETLLAAQASELRLRLLTRGRGRGRFLGCGTSASWTSDLRKDPRRSEERGVIWRLTQCTHLAAARALPLHQERNRGHPDNVGSI